MKKLSPKLIEMFESLRLGLKPIQTFEVDEDFFNDFREESKKVERSAEDKEDS